MATIYLQGNAEHDYTFRIDSLIQAYLYPNPGVLQCVVSLSPKCHSKPLFPQHSIHTAAILAKFFV